MPFKGGSYACAFVFHVWALQVIKELYEGFPEKVAKKLADSKGANREKSIEESLKNELNAEVEYLRDVEKLDDAGIQRWLPGTKDPVTAGVHKPGGVMRVSQLEPAPGT